MPKNTRRIHGNTREELDEFFSSQDVVASPESPPSVKESHTNLKRKGDLQPPSSPPRKARRTRSVRNPVESPPQLSSETSLDLGSSSKMKMKPTFLKDHLFKGLRFSKFVTQSASLSNILVMVPTRPSTKIFQTRSKKFQEYGAAIDHHFSPSITHVVIDTDYDGQRTLKYLHIDHESIRSNVENGALKFVRDEWPSKCIEQHKLIPESDYVVSVLPAPIVTNQSENLQKPVIPSKPQPPSPLKKRDSSSSSNTPPPASNPEPISPPDELEAMIKQTAQEDNDSGHLSDDEIESALSNYRSKYSAPSGPRPLPQRTSDGRVLKGKWDAFLCMKEEEHGDSASETGPNDRTIKILSLMHDHYEAEGDQWRTQGYRKAIRSLKNQKIPIRTAAQAVKLPGVGQRIADKIEEINKTGDLKRLIFTQEEGKDKVLALLKGIYGVGTKIANKWYNEGIRTLDDVKQKTDLTSNQKISLEHYTDFVERIPRQFVTMHYQKVVDAVHQIDPKVEATAMGSYRRLQPDCGDIDIILTKPNATKHELCVILAKLLDQLFDEEFAKYTFGGVEANSMRWLGATAHPEDGNKWRRMDILLVPWEERGAAFIYYTGNDIFNRSIRLLAQKKGYRLNEKGLFLAPSRKTRKAPPGAVGPLICGDDEKKIFEVLGVPYRPPHKRVIG